MKKILLMIALIMSVSGCARTTDTQATAETKFTDEQKSTAEATQTMDADEPQAETLDELAQTFSDWVQGTEYGVEEIKADLDGKVFEIVISDENYYKLMDYDFGDIRKGITDILSLYGVESGFSIVFSNGDVLTGEAADNTVVDAGESTEPEETADDAIGADTVNLIFIHHSVGENWLNAGLNQMLNDSGFHVADTYYGWKEMGDRTDTSDWPDWFNDRVMPGVYSELGNMTGYNSIEPAPGENTVVMFKSCYPNSDVGNSIEDEKEIYLSLLSYFEAHRDKMFVLVTPPPMQRIPHADKTRELANWLVANDGWRGDYAGGNLFVFDFYNILTAEDNHHMLIDGAESHIINDGSNTLYYDSSGDDHPNDMGSLKAAEEFVPLFIYWYKEFSGQK